jgi:acyl-coenzyme A thioesterase PaaI-like protein
VLERAIIGSLGIGWEKAGGEFPVRPVIIKTIAARSLVLAGFIATVADTAVAILLAFHRCPSIDE